LGPTSKERGRDGRGGEEREGKGGEGRGGEGKGHEPPTIWRKFTLMKANITFAAHCRYVNVLLSNIY